VVRLATRALSALIACVAVLVASSKEASADGRFQVAVPAGCGDATTFIGELGRLLGERVEEAAPVLLRIVGPDNAGVYRLELVLRGEVRVLTDHDCWALFRSGVVIVAASVRPELAMQGLEPVPPPPPPRPPPMQASGESAALREAASASEPFYAGLGVGVGVRVGVLPGVAPALDLVGSLGSGPWGLGWALAYSPPSQSEPREGRSVDVSSIGGRLAGLVEPQPYLRLSAGLWVHSLRGRGRGITSPSSAWVWGAGPSLEITAIGRLSPGLQAELGLEGQWLASRPRFEISGFGEVYRTSLFSAASSLRLAWLFL
jgi:hypothetical protein